MKLYIYLPFTKLQEIGGSKDIDLEQIKESLEQRDSFAARRNENYPGQDKIYISKKRAVMCNEQPGILVTVKVKRNKECDELENILNYDIEKEDYYFKRFKVEVVE